jgi:Na+/proline symporter
MGLGVSIFLIAVGAILAFAVNATVSGVDIHTIGWILLIVGILGAVLSAIFWSSWGGPGYATRRRTTYVEDGPPAGPPY